MMPSHFLPKSGGLRLLKSPHKMTISPGLLKVRDSSVEWQPETEVHALVLDAATAFTDLRRLQILRRLDAHGPATVAQIREELSMSKQAVSRHMTKLTRRGYVVAADAQAGAQAYALAAQAKTPVHAELLGIIRAVWRKE